jgi:hypothetical protein
MAKWVKVNDKRYTKTIGDMEFRLEKGDSASSFILYVNGSMYKDTGRVGIEAAKRSVKWIISGIISLWGKVWTP